MDYTANGNLIVRYADNREWVDKEDYALFNGISNSIGSKMLRRDTATNGATLATATVCYVTNHTTGQISRYTADNRGCRTYRKLHF